MIKKSVCGVLAGTILFSSLVLTQNSVKADTINVKSESDLLNAYESDINNLKVNVDELIAIGLTQEEIDIVLSDSSASGIYLLNGVTYNKNGDILEVQERGKLSWAVKLLRAAWDKLPGWAQGALGLTGFEKLLDFVDHFTGTIEDAVYEGCKSLGMSDSVANAVTKILLFVAL